MMEAAQANPPDIKDRDWQFGLWVLIACTTVMHLLMLVYDRAHPNLYMMADRAWERNNAILLLTRLFDGEITAKQFFSAEGTSNAVPGDYVFQGIAFAAGGQTAVILLQCILFIASVAAVYHLAKLLTSSNIIALSSALLYALLPQGLIFAHMLWSESIFNPLVVIGYYVSARAILLGGAGNVIGAAILIALATLVRGWVLPLGLVFVAAYWLSFRSARHVAMYVMIVGSIIAIWPTLRWASTGEFAMARSEVSSAGHIAYNLNERLRMMIQTLPNDVKSAAEARYAPTDPHTTVSSALSRFASFAVTHPILFIRGLNQDLFVYVAQSGIERVTVDYLELIGSAREEIQKRHEGWHLMLYEKGILETIKYFMGFGWVFALSIIGVIATLVFWAFAALGTFASIKVMPGEVGLPRALILLSLAGFTCFAFLPGLLLFFPQVRYRSPAEFGLSILAVLGASYLLRLIRARSSFATPVNESGARAQIV